MSGQTSFADLDYQHKRHKTRRERFLERLEGLVPWERLEQHIVPHYPKAGRGRRPDPLSVMLRVHVVQVTYNLSDPAMEDLLYEAESVRRFAGLRLSEDISDESTILNFRHLLERHRLGQELFEEIKGHLEERGVMLKRGSIVNATIIAAPSSTKNKAILRSKASQQPTQPNNRCYPHLFRASLSVTLTALCGAETANLGLECSNAVLISGFHRGEFTQA